MKLTRAQIRFIQRDISQRGIEMDDLADSLVDHICCTIECSGEDNFDKAYAEALDEFGENGLQKVQQATIFELTFKKEQTMKTVMYVLGYVAAMLTTSGLLFKLQHWPGAAILLTLGIAILNFGFLPMYFYRRYQSASR